MSLDFFDDDDNILDIPSIAPDLMFVEDENHATQNKMSLTQLKKTVEESPDTAKTTQGENGQQIQQLSMVDTSHLQPIIKSSALNQNSPQLEDISTRKPESPERHTQQIEQSQTLNENPRDPLSVPNAVDDKDFKQGNVDQAEEQSTESQPNEQLLESDANEQTPQQNEPTPTPSFVESKILTPAERAALISMIFDDHSYAKPYKSKATTKETQITLPSSEMSILKLHPKDFPAKKKSRKRAKKNNETDDDEIDVVGVDKPDDVLVKYDTSRARHIMNDVEAYLNSLWKDVEKDDEEKISRGSWSKEQARLFDAIFKLINNYQLAKLSYAQNSNEPVLRRLALEKATKRTRKAFGTVMWSAKQIVWLHGVMIDGLCSSFFLCYLEILQALKRKVPSLFERIFLNNKAALEKEQTAGLANLGSRLKKSWEPSVGLHTKVNMEKFPSTPYLITIPCGPTVPHQSTKRTRFWNYQLLNIGKSVHISTPAYRTPEGYVVKHYLEHCISSVRSKINEFSTRFPDRPIVLLGWGVGSMVALKIALLEKVDAVVCLGFPCRRLEGDECEDYWNSFTKVECPILFILGTHATTNSIDFTEELRKKMKTYTNLIVMESGDELLRLTKSQKRSLGMSQNMIDKLLQDQIYLFLKAVLFKPKSIFTQIKEGSTPKKRKKISTTSANETASKKRKKSSKSLNKNNASFTLPPLDVSVPGHPGLPSTSIMQGLLTTGSISTPIPVTQLQNENLITQQQQQPLSTDQSTPKIGLKRPSTGSNKEKSAKRKAPKKAGTTSLKTPSLQQQANQRTIGTIFGQPFLSTSQHHNATLQRLPSGTFVLSGATGNMRLQGGANIVYLQQLTSSGGTTKVIQAPLIANANGTFSALPLFSASGSSSESSTATSNPKDAQKARSMDPQKILAVSDANKGGSGNTKKSTSSNSVTTTTTMTTKYLPSSTGTVKPANLILSTSLPSFQPTRTPESSMISNTNGLNQTANSTTVTTVKSVMLTLPTVQDTDVITTSSEPIDANAQAQAILQQLSQDEIKCLASLIGKYSSHPNSPASTSPTSVKPPDFDRSPTSSYFSSSVVKSSSSNTSNKAASTLRSLLGQGTSRIAVNENSKKATQLSNLLQEKQHSSLPKSPQVTTGVSLTKTGTASTTPSQALKHPKVPITITIPLSRLPTSLQLSTSISKSINVPALSAYLSQQKFILSTGKTSSSRTVVLSPGSIKKASVISTPTRVGSSKAHTKTSTPTFTVKLASQPKDTLSLKKAASDIKLVGMLNQKTKQVPLFSPSLSSSSSSSSLIKKIQSIPTSLSKQVSSTNGVSLSGGTPKQQTADQYEIDESDVDFAVMASVSKTVVPLSTAAGSSPIVSASKIIRVPIGQSLQKLQAKQIELPKLKSPCSESSFMNSVRNVGLMFQNKTTIEAKTTTISESSKLRFEPITSTSFAARPKLSAVLSSMRETGKVVMDEHGQLRSTIIAKPAAVNSKAAMIARNAFVTDTSKLTTTKISVNTSIIKSPITKPSVPSLFTLGQSTASSVIGSPAATIRTASKVLPVTIKSSEFIRMSNQVKGVGSSTLKTSPKTVKKDATGTNMKTMEVSKETKSTTRTKSNSSDSPSSPEEPPAPPPYITRSGRVLRTRYPFSEDNERKPSPKKRRRTISTSSKDDQSTTTPTTPTTPIGNIGNALDSLVEAAKMITSEKPVEETQLSNEPKESMENSSKDSMANIDVTNLAATAMLELLSSSSVAKSKNKNMDFSTNNTHRPTESVMETVANNEATRDDQRTVKLTTEERLALVMPDVFKSSSSTIPEDTSLSVDKNSVQCPIDENNVSVFPIIPENKIKEVKGTSDAAIVDSLLDSTRVKSNPSTVVQQSSAENTKEIEPLNQSKETEE